MILKMRKYRYFNEEEFKKAVPACSIENMDIAFMNKLDSARHLANKPFVILSAYRNEGWEKLMGRSGTSSHTKGVAVDIRCNNSPDRLKIVDALLKVGFRRIGIYESFIHVDNDQDKIECLFLG